MLVFYFNFMTISFELTFQAHHHLLFGGCTWLQSKQTGRGSQ